MKTKVTITLEQDLVPRAKSLARRQGHYRNSPIPAVTPVEALAKLT